MEGRDACVPGHAPLKAGARGVHRAAMKGEGQPLLVLQPPAAREAVRGSVCMAVTLVTSTDCVNASMSCKR